MPIEVKARHPEKDVSATALINIGDNLEQLVETVGKEVVYSCAIAHTKVMAQARIRALIEAGKSQDEISAEMSTWKPGVVAARVTMDPLTKAVTLLKAMSPEDRAKLLAEIGLTPGDTKAKRQG